MSNSSLRNVWILFKHEYLNRIRTRSFLLTTLLMPLFMGVMVIIPALEMAHSRQPQQRMVLVCANPRLSNALRAQIEQTTNGRYSVEVDNDDSNAERDRLDRRLAHSDIDGYIWMAPGAVENGEAQLVKRDAGDFVGEELIRGAISSAIDRVRLTRRGMSPAEADSVLGGARVQTFIAGAQGSDGEDPGVGAVVVVLLFVIVLFITLLSYGVMVMRSVLEEKSSRVVEILLCSTTAEQLMSGKILGVGAVGLTQVAIWACFGGLLTMTRAGAPAAHIPVSFALYFALFFVLGYLLYSALFAAAGATFNSADEAQHWNFVIISPLVLASVLMTPVASAPGSALSVAVSMIPFFSPVLMYLRLVLQPPPAWQVALSIGILLVSIYFALAVSARIYRVGILMYGKRATVREILKWLRYA